MELFPRQIDKWLTPIEHILHASIIEQSIIIKVIAYHIKRINANTIQHVYNRRCTIELNNISIEKL